jgi:putative peptidoglycan lipid II flippase
MRDEPLLSSSNRLQKPSLHALSDPVKDAQGEHRKLVRAAGMVSGLTMLSRLMGLVREQTFAALLGAGLHGDAFRAAFRIPNLLRDLFAEGALSAAFVPTYARAVHEGGPEAAHRLANRLLTLLVVVLGALVVLGFLLVGPLVSTLAPGFETIAGKAELTRRLTRVMLPFLPLVSFAAVAMGMLNARERYGAPAFAPAMFNIVTIVWACGLWSLGLPAEQVALGWAIGTLLGGAAQFLVQVPPLRREGFRFQWDWAPLDPGIRRIAGLMLPATVGLAAVQVNIFVNTRFASHEPGAVSWLDYAFRILYLPIGIFGVAVGTIATTGLARRVAEGDTEGLRSTLRQSLRTLAFLTIPATVGLWAAGTPVVRLLYERGLFDAHDTDGTAAALSYYALGLVAYTGVKVLAPAFYALGTPRVPLLASASAVLINLVTIAALHGSLGYRSVALGTAIGSLANAGLLVVVFERRVGGLLDRPLVAGLAKMALASAAMSVVVVASVTGLEARLGTRGLTVRLVTGLVPVAVGVLAYAGVARALRLSELDAIAGALRRRSRKPEA